MMDATKLDLLQMDTHQTTCSMSLLRVVSLKSLCLEMLLSELNQLELWRTDIQNAYLEACTKETLFIVAGPEFDELTGHILVMYKALYGTRTAGAHWHDRHFDVLQDMEFVPTKVDPDVWMRQAKDGSCHEYIAVYVDDLPIGAKNPKEITNQLQHKHNFKFRGT